MLGEKARWEQLKDCSRLFWTNPWSIPLKTTALWTLTYYHTNNPRRAEYAEYCLRRNDKLINDFGGARGVMVIVVGIEHDDTSSNPGRDWLHFT